MNILNDAERGERLSAALKQLYDRPSEDEGASVREQFMHCADHCVPPEEANV